MSLDLKGLDAIIDDVRAQGSQPNQIVMSEPMFRSYAQQVNSLARYAPEPTWRTHRYDGIPVVTNPTVPADTVYVMDTSHMKIEGRSFDMAIIDDPPNQRRSFVEAMDEAIEDYKQAIREELNKSIGLLSVLEPERNTMHNERHIPLTDAVWAKHLAPPVMPKLKKGRKVTILQREMNRDAVTHVTYTVADKRTTDAGQRRYLLIQDNAVPGFGPAGTGTVLTHEELVNEFDAGRLEVA